MAYKKKSNLNNGCWIHYHIHMFLQHEMISPKYSLTLWSLTHPE